ncbi:MAG: recombinase family protein [Lachnospiraceae bacterium]|nr:recombinase family protein [Lachnospiraceae bacterium]
MDAEARGEGETLARHQKRLEELAERMHIDLPAENFFREIVSGETIAARPVMQDLLRQVESGLWDGVFVVEVERLARGDTMDQGQVAKSFKRAGTKIITPTKIYDPDNEFDEEYFEFGLFMSRREYKTIRRRLDAGRVAAVKEGKFIASVAPYGYRKVKLKNDTGYSLEIVPEEAAIVRMIFEMYTRSEDGERVGTVTIAARLDEMKVSPRNGGRWAKDSIRDILTNPVYIGKIRWGYKKETKNYDNGRIVKTRHRNEEYLLCDGLHEPIIDDVTFALAERYLKENRQSMTSPTRELQNPLSGIVYCKMCGQLMTRLGPNSRNLYATLKCPARGCKNVSAPIYIVEKELMRSLDDWCKEYELQLPIPHLPASLNAKYEALKAEQARKETFEKQLLNTFDLLEQGLYTPELFKSRQQLLNKQIDACEETILKLQKDYDAAADVQRIRTGFLPLVKEVLQAYPLTESAQEKNDMLKQVLRSATYLKEKPNHKGTRENVNFELDIFPLL